MLPCYLQWSPPVALQQEKIKQFENLIAKSGQPLVKRKMTTKLVLSITARELIIRNYLLCLYFSYIEIIRLTEVIFWARNSKTL